MRHRKPWTACIELRNLNQPLNKSIYLCTVDYIIALISYRHAIDSQTRAQFELFSLCLYISTRAFFVLGVIAV